jgi:ribosomal protein S18 acetylase RimI-like enzyme
VNVELLGGDLLALAQCAAIDLTAFPHASLPAPGKHAPVLIARDAGRVIGFVSTLRSGDTLEIAGLAVDARYRRRGAGRALLRAAIELAEDMGLRFVRLHVSTANAGAMALYHREGFRVTRTIRRHYARGTFGNDGDAVEMLREL